MHLIGLNFRGFFLWSLPVPFEIVRHFLDFYQKYMAAMLGLQPQAYPLNGTLGMFFYDIPTYLRGWMSIVIHRSTRNALLTFEMYL